nr:hypothetical protein [Tanacetum cinerariifolium]
YGETEDYSLSITGGTTIAAQGLTATTAALDAGAELSLYPNPAADQLNLSLSSGAELKSVEVLDVRGAKASVRYLGNGEPGISGRKIVEALELKFGGGRAHHRLRGEAMQRVGPFHDGTVPGARLAYGAGYPVGHQPLLGGNGQRRALAVVGENAAHPRALQQGQRLFVECLDGFERLALGGPGQAHVASRLVEKLARLVLKKQRLPGVGR